VSPNFKPDGVYVNAGSAESYTFVFAAAVIVNVFAVIVKFAELNVIE
jgi:hypothetical protein